jgi:hypothetical protein
MADDLTARRLALLRDKILMATEEYDWRCRSLGEMTCRGRDDRWGAHRETVVLARPASGY